MMPSKESSRADKRSSLQAFWLFSSQSLKWAYIPVGTVWIGGTGSTAYLSSPHEGLLWHCVTVNLRIYKLLTSPHSQG